MSNQPRLKILVADDSATDRLILETLLKRQGHEVLLASNGREAVAIFRSGHPDIVLMDVMMPELDGIGAARKMRVIAGNELIPIIFLTSLNQARDLAACLDAGGDDFLNKPCNPVILQAKIKAFSRLRRLHSEVRAQREHLLAEQRTAKALFDRIARQGALDKPNIRYLMSPVAIFNGDVLLAAQQPGGDLLVFLGDFTGHGLPAAIGIMPLAEIFHGMVARSFGLEDVLREINSRLHAVLPATTFCCATALQLNYRQRRIEVWAGGLPDGAVFRRGTRELLRLSSTHLPLGVLAPERFRYFPVSVEMHADTAVYLWSDGVTETCDRDGMMFGEERLLSLFAEAPDPAGMFDEITARLRDFSGHGKQGDDYSLVEVTPAENALPHRADVAPSVSDPGRGSGNWSLEIEWHADSLRHADPLPALMQMFLQVPGLRHHGTEVSTILGELYSNALEHGVLGLASSLKTDADGFQRYYRLRTERLDALRHASIRIRAEVLPLPAGGLLRLQVRDSGPGFDHAAVAEGGVPPYYGRGLRLLASLCRRVEYCEPGNEVMVEFAWDEQGGGDRG